MIEQLWIDMYERDYVGLKDVLAIQKWLELLSQIGYQFPKVSQTSENTNDQDDSSNSG